ncbi:unnamed protein product, partial [Prorocentrum cordatum]
QALWKFLELPSPGVVAARYLYKTRQLTYISQIRKLMASKYLMEHAYRLGHASVIKVNLHLLSTESREGGEAGPPLSVMLASRSSSGPLVALPTPRLGAA